MEDSLHVFRQLAEALPEMLWTSKLDGAEYVGPRWLEYLGVTDAEMLRRGWPDFLHPDDRERVVLELRAAHLERRAFETEYRVRRYDGQYRWCESHAIPVRNQQGELVRWMGVSRDIHEAHEMRQALLDERDRFRRIVESAPGAIYSYRVSASGAESFPFASAAIRDLFGIEAEDLTRSADEAWKRIPPEDAARVRASLGRSADRLTPCNVEWRILNPHRGELWVESRSIPTREPSGDTVWYGILVDITERKRADHELRRSRSRLEAAVLASGIGTFIWEIEEKRIWWDDALLRMFNRTRAEVESLNVYEGVAKLVAPEDQSKVGEAFLAVRDGKQDLVGVEFRASRNDGAVQWIALKCRTERDARGRMMRVTGACMDITQAKHAEEAQLASQKIEALCTLAAGIAHDFNNILLAITGNARLALAELPEEHPTHRQLEEIDRAGVRATELVQRILAFGRHTEARREIVDLSPPIEEALKLLRQKLPATIEIRSHIAADAPAVSADPSQIHQIVINLVTNSADAIGAEPGVISIALERCLVSATDTAAEDVPPGVYLRLSVSDTGCGMDPEIQKRIYDPFFTTKPPGHGTGLGLSMVHGVVRSHGGTIAVEGSPGKGAVFRVYLPAARETQTPASASAPSARISSAQGRGQHVMYVDDEDALVYLVSRVLQKLGYEVSGFTDPGEALAAFQKDPQAFDVVVTDLSMPGMSGFHLAGALLAARPDIKILMTSGYVRPEDRERAKSLGIRDLILKPDTLEELGGSLARLFDERSDS